MFGYKQHSSSRAENKCSQKFNRLTMVKYTDTLNQPEKKEKEEGEKILFFYEYERYIFSLLFYNQCLNKVHIWFGVLVIQNTNDTVIE